MVGDVGVRRVWRGAGRVDWVNDGVFEETNRRLTSVSANDAVRETSGVRVKPGRLGKPDKARRYFSGVSDFGDATEFSDATLFNVSKNLSAE